MAFITSNPTAAFIAVIDSSVIVNSRFAKLLNGERLSTSYFPISSDFFSSFGSCFKLLRTPVGDMFSPIIVALAAIYCEI